MAIAEAFATAGSRVALVARTKSAIDTLAARLGGTAHVCDLGDPNQLRGLIQRVEDAGGPIDVLVNNAAIEAVGSLDRTSEEELEQLFRVNLIAPAELCRQVLPGMLRRGTGHFVNVSSTSGSAPFPGLVAYAASKAGLSHWTACLRADLANTGVNSTLVELGTVQTDMLATIRAYPPCHAALARAYKLHLIRDVRPAEAAQGIVAAVRKNRRHVRLPSRTATFCMISELPRVLSEWLLAGIPR